jgi:hypothetical protein
LKENRTEKDKVVESSTTAEPKDEINEEWFEAIKNFLRFLRK